MVAGKSGQIHFITVTDQVKMNYIKYLNSEKGITSSREKYATKLFFQ